MSGYDNPRFPKISDPESWDLSYAQCVRCTRVFGWSLTEHRYALRSFSTVGPHAFMDTRIVFDGIDNRNICCPYCTYKGLVAVSEKEYDEYKGRMTN